MGDMIFNGQYEGRATCSIVEGAEQRVVEYANHKRRAFLEEDDVKMERRSSDYLYSNVWVK
jgi:hypothetical protein